MSENEQNKTEEIKQESDLKQETAKTINEAKEKMKNINLKQEAEVGKGLLQKLCKDPIETIKEIANDKENKAFKTALLLVAVWLVVVLIDRILYYATNRYTIFNFLSTLKLVVAPVLTIIAMTLSVYFVSNKEKASITKILTSVIFAYIPIIISRILYLLHFISTRMYTILTPVSGLLNVISIVLMYHTIKTLAKEENETNALKSFIKVEAVFYVIAFVISFLGITL